MQHISLKNHKQYELKSLEGFVEKEDTVGFVDAFAHIYGYLNGKRSSRKLEKECVRNTELQWLICVLSPNYHSIADFRKVNLQAFRNKFKLFMLFLKDADLVSGNTIAINGTK